MLPPLKIPERLLRHWRPVMAVALSAVALARILDIFYRPRAVIARSDQRLLFAAVWQGRPTNDRVNVYRTIDRRGVDNDAFDLGPVELSPDGNKVAIYETESGFDFYDVILEILSMRTGASLYYATDVSYPDGTWLANDPDAPGFLVAAQARIAMDYPDWDGVLDAHFIDDVNNDIRLLNWIAEGIVVGGTTLMQNDEWLISEPVPWWRALGRDLLGRYSVVLAEGLGTHPYTPLAAPVPEVTLTVGSGTPDYLLVDGVRQRTAALAPGVRFASGAW